MIKQHSLKAST